MAKNRDDNMNQKGSGEFSLEDILVEYGDDGKILPFPRARKDPAAEPSDEAVLNLDLHSEPESELEEETTLTNDSPSPISSKRRFFRENVLHFPRKAEPDASEINLQESPLQSGLQKLRQKADEYADHMFEDEGVEDCEETRTAEQYLPGVDDEDEDAPLRIRKPRPAPPPAPDLPAQELYRRYTRGLRFLRLRAILLFILTLPALYLTMALFFHWPLPGPLGQSYEIQIYMLAFLLGAAILLGIDVFLMGLFHVIHTGFGMDTLVSLSCLAALADALTLQSLGGRGGQLPYCAIAALALGFTMWGRYLQRRGSRSACRTASSASEPYLVTRDEGKWNGREAYSKWSGKSVGFGSQMQAPDGAQRIFRVVAPLLFLACILLSMVSSLGQHKPEQILWCLSSTLSAGASFSALLCFGMPWSRLSLRLSKSGAALAGWDGVAGAGGCAEILLTDRDLFPPGSVTLNGIKVFGDFPVEKVVACTATLIRDSGGGLDKTFHDLLRSQGAVYRRCEQFAVYEGGLTAVIRSDQVLVGSSAFMRLMEINLPQGLHVKNAVFCAINGELAGVFALNYSLHPAVASSLTALTCNRIRPVLATRDFNLVPAMLRQRFKLPVERMEFPSVARRSELSDPAQAHNHVLSAVLCREGLAPFSEAVVGGKRLHMTVRFNAFFASLGSFVGILTAFYLTFSGSFVSLSPTNLFIFLLMWLVPIVLISNWTDRY